MAGNLRNEESIGTFAGAPSMTTGEIVLPNVRKNAGIIYDRI